MGKTIPKLTRVALHKLVTELTPRDCDIRGEAIKFLANKLTSHVSASFLDYNGRQIIFPTIFVEDKRRMTRLSSQRVFDDIFTILYAKCPRNEYVSKIHEEVGEVVRAELGKAYNVFTLKHEHILVKGFVYSVSNEIADFICASATGIRYMADKHCLDGEPFDTDIVEAIFNGYEKVRSVLQSIQTKNIRICDEICRRIPTSILEKTDEFTVGISDYMDILKVVHSHCVDGRHLTDSSEYLVVDILKRFSIHELIEEPLRVIKALRYSKMGDPYTMGETVNRIMRLSKEERLHSIIEKMRDLRAAIAEKI